MHKNPRVVWRLAMLSLLAFFATTLIARSAAPARQDLLDGVRGVLLGAAIGLMIVMGVIKRRIGATQAR